LTVSGCLLLSLGLEKMPRWAVRPVVFVGALSLEIYLIHSNFFIQWLRPLHLGYWPTVALTLLCSIPVAWILKKLRSLIKI